jgi:hypothetical protein
MKSKELSRTSNEVKTELDEVERKSVEDTTLSPNTAERK